MWPVRPATQRSCRSRCHDESNETHESREGGDVSSEPLPVTGAWQPTDPTGCRRFFTFANDHPFALESGVALRDVTIAYETWGVLNDDRSNAVLVCHAWTGDSHASGPRRHRSQRTGLVVRRHRSRVGARHRPVVRRVRQRARWLSGLDRSGVAAPDRRSSVRFALPRRHDPRHGARPGPPDAAPR